MDMKGEVALAAIDDHEVVLVGLAALAAQQPRIIGSFVGAATVAELLARRPEGGVDVVLLDIHLNDNSDLRESVVRLTAAFGCVVLLTSDLRPVPIRTGIQAGARGIALKSDPTDRLVETVRTAVAGDFAVSSELGHVLATDPRLCAHLAPRELEALRLLASGLPKKQLGRWMRPPVESTTVTTYLNRIATRYAELGRPVGNIYGSVREAHADGHLS